MSSWIKPPIGVSPGWFVYKHRLNDLLEAMQRYSEHIDKYVSQLDTQQCKEYYKLIQKWAKEVEMLCDLNIHQLR